VLLNKSVLVVDDEFLLRANIEGVLIDSGWTAIRSVGTVRKRLEPETERPAVTILNVRLHGSAVAAVAAELRRLGIPFVLCSAHDHPELIGGEVLAGVPNAGKPLDAARLLEFLNEAVMSRGIGRDDGD
jgi:two-component system, response regulator PdtaR